MPLSCQDDDRVGWHHTIARFTPRRGELVIPGTRTRGPFTWTKSADQILSTIASHCQRINDSGHWDQSPLFSRHDLGAPCEDVEQTLTTLRRSADEQHAQAEGEDRQ